MSEVSFEDESINDDNNKKVGSSKDLDIYHLLSDLKYIDLMPIGEEVKKGMKEDRMKLYHSFTDVIVQNNSNSLTISKNIEDLHLYIKELGKVNSEYVSHGNFAIIHQYTNVLCRFFMVNSEIIDRYLTINCKGRTLSTFEDLKSLEKAIIKVSSESELRFVDVFMLIDNVTKMLAIYHSIIRNNLLSQKLFTEKDLFTNIEIIDGETNE